MHISNSPNAIPGLSARPSSARKNLFGDTLWVGINGEIRCTRHAGYSLLNVASCAPLAVEHFTDNNNHWIHTDADVFAGKLNDAECEACRS